MRNSTSTIVLTAAELHWAPPAQNRLLMIMVLACWLGAGRTEDRGELRAGRHGQGRSG
jgi:hypothetical protein